MYPSLGTPGLDNQSNWGKMTYYWGYIVRTRLCGKLIASYTRNCLQANVSVNSESQYKINRYKGALKNVQLWFNVKFLLCDNPEKVKDFEITFFLIIKFKSNDRKETSSTIHQVLLISSSEMLLQWPLIYQTFPSPFTTSQCAKGKHIPFPKCLE